MYTINDIFNVLNDIAPVETAEEFDNVGILIAAKRESIVKKVMVTLDITTSVVKEAIDKKVDTIISHHPFIFEPIKVITDDDWKGRAILKLIDNNISVISMHTNFDKADKGLNYYLAKKLKLTSIKKLEQSEYIRIGILVEDMSIDSFAEQVKECLNIPSVRVIMPKNKIDKINKVAVFSGSSDISEILKFSNEYDVAVCGDIKYHKALDISYGDIPVIDAGHYGTEWIFTEQVFGILNEKLPEIDVLTATTHVNPFVMV